MKTIAQSMFGEGLEEGVTEFAQSLTRYIVEGDKTALDGIATRAIDAGLVGAASGATMTGPSVAVAARHRQAQARQAEKTKEFFLAIGETVTESKLKDRLPAAQRAHMRPSPRTARLKTSTLARTNSIPIAKKTI
jgi:hypothetical protein